MDYSLLVRRARAARRFSHAPYSHFRVGAALLTRSGKVFTGCNIESSSFGLTVCAERTALFKAVSEGHRRFRAIAVATGEPVWTPPCGACRQVLADLAGDIECILVAARGRHRIFRLSELFPHPFHDQALLRTRTHDDSNAS